MGRGSDPTPEDTMDSLNFEVETSMKRKLQQEAARGDRSVSSILRLIVKQYLEGKGPRI